MNPSTLEATQTVVGTWRLASFYIQKEDGSVAYPYGHDAEGSLIYTESGLMSVQIMRNGRPPFANGDQQRGTSAEMAASFKGCVSYYGSYALNVEGGFVIHNIERSLFPNWEGEAHKRFFTLTQDSLTLKTPPVLWDGLQAIGVVTWQIA